MAIYAEGELTEYLSLHSSYEKFTDNDTVKYAGYEIDLPLKMPAGIYKEKIIVRYLPKSRFKGKAPSEEHEITVNVMQGEKDIFALKNRHYLYILAAVLGLVFLINGILLLRKKKQ